MTYDKDIRQSYKGGWTYLNPKYKGKIVNSGIVLDVNSLYPFVMRYSLLPYDNGIYFDGKYKEDKLYNLYVQKFKCMFQLKVGFLPTIQIKKDLDFVSTEYLESSKTKTGKWKEVTLTLTSVDLKLFLDHYDVYNVDWIGGYKFKSSERLFDTYIDKWVKVKIDSDINGNNSMRAIAKLMLNSLYGKFSLNPDVRSKYPMYDKTKDLIHYVYGDWDTRTPLYIPVGTFITSYAREKTIRSAQKCYDRFIYADTDSLHLEGEEIPEGLYIHNTDLGAWKHEFTFDKGKYLRQKCYMERGYDTKKPEEIFTKIVCAGMPDRCYEHVTFENFEIDSKFDGKLQTTRVSGGIVLTENHYTIKNNLFY